MDLAISEKAHASLQDVHDRKTGEMFPEQAIAEISDAICKKFEGVYGSMDILEKRIEEDGIPLSDHTLWDDVIEWRNSVSNLDQLNYYNNII